MNFSLNRREFLALTSASAVSTMVNPNSQAEPLPETASPSQAGPETRWQRQAEHKLESAKGVTWMTHEPLYFIQRRGGDRFVDEAEIYEQMYEPENIKRMAAAGVRYAMIHFYKGFGLEYERAQIERTRQAAALMHQLGMKVGLYFAGTMFIETLYREVPDAKIWEQRDQHDRWVSYGSQTYRHYACPNEPAYRDYLKPILKIAVERVKADEIALDNLMLQPEPKSCRCWRCQSAFREMLRRRYPTRESVTRRFGLPDVDSIWINEWDPTLAPADAVRVLDDPVLQEWVWFRCESLANHAKALSEYVKSLNPNVSVLMNIKGLYSFNRYWTNAVYHPLFAGHIDEMSFDTGGYNARIDLETGALVSQIRSYKVARLIGTSCQESLSDELQAAVHMAFNHATDVKGYPGAPYAAGAANIFTPILEFFRHYNDRYYTKTQSVADVAVLLTWPSMAYSINAAWAPSTLLEQVLIQYKIPFSLLFNEQFDRIGNYSAVILPEQECISQAQVDGLLNYVRNGGTLVLTGSAATYNERRERWRNNPLLPARREGKGRIVYIPKIVPAIPASRQMSPPQWVLPKNHQEIYTAIVNNLPRQLSITTKAPLTTVLELLKRPETRESIVHFVNFDRQNPLAPFPVTLQKQYSSSVKSVTCFSPHADDPQPLRFQESGGQVRFTVPRTQLYAMIVIAHA
jgi:Beta-galactosidase